jgi:hypothetical protein
MNLHSGWDAGRSHDFQSVIDSIVNRADRGTGSTFFDMIV